MRYVSQGWRLRIPIVGGRGNIVVMKYHSCQGLRGGMVSCAGSFGVG